MTPKYPVWHVFEPRLTECEINPFREHAPSPPPEPVLHIPAGASYEVAAAKLKKVHEEHADKLEQFNRRNTDWQERRQADIDRRAQLGQQREARFCKEFDLTQEQFAELDENCPEGGYDVSYWDMMSFAANARRLT